MASPSGELYATHCQVTRLEEIVQKQQIIIENLEQNKLFLMENLSSNIDAQIEEASKRRGSVGAEYMNITKFITKQLTEGLLKIQNHVSKNIEESLPLKMVQELEKRLFAKPLASDDLASLALRVSHLENSREKSPSSDSKPTVTVQEIESLKKQVQNLESVLVQEAQRVHKTTSAAAGEYAIPLVRLQSQVDLLQKDIQIIKSVDGQSLAESILKSSLNTFKNEINKFLETKVEKDDFQKIQCDISRIENFSREIQTGFYAMKKKVEQTIEEMPNTVFKNIFETMEISLKQNSVSIIEDAITMYNSKLEIQRKQVKSLINELEESRNKMKIMVDEHKQNIDIIITDALHMQRTQFDSQKEQIKIMIKELGDVELRMNSVEKKLQRDNEIMIENALTLQDTKFKIQVENIKKMMQEWEETKKDKTFQENLERDIKNIIKRIEDEKTETIFEFKSQYLNIKKEQSEFIEKINNAVDSSTIKNLYMEFTNKLEKTSEYFTKWKADIEEFQLEITKQKSQIKNIKSEVLNEINLFNKLIEDTKLSIKSEFDNWIQNKEELFNQKIIMSENYINKVKENYLLMEKEISKQFNEFRLREEDNYKNFQTVMLSKFESWLGERNEYLSKRIFDIQERIRTLITQANKREEDLLKLFSENTLKEFVAECERRIKITQDNWMQRRKEELQIKYSEIDRNIGIIRDIAKEVEVRENHMTKLFGENAMIDLFNKIDKKLIMFQNQIENGPTINNQNKYYNSLAKCFYTAIFVDSDDLAGKLAPVYQKIPDWEYFCFTNASIESVPGWTIINVSNINNFKLDEKRYKWLSHKYLENFDIAVWVDCSIAPNSVYSGVLKECILDMTENFIAIGNRPHDTRNCVYKECDYIKDLKNETTNNIEYVKKLLKDAYVPENNGLFDTNIMIRFHKITETQQISEKIYYYLENILHHEQLVVPLVYFTDNFSEKYYKFKAYELLYVF